MRAVLVNIEEQPNVIDIDNTLDAFQNEINGNVSSGYPFKDKAAIICNSNGNEVGLPINRPLLNEERRTIDIICGNFLVVGVGEDDFCDLTDAQVKRYMAMFRLSEVK